VTFAHKKDVLQQGTFPDDDFDRTFVWGGQRIKVYFKNALAFCLKHQGVLPRMPGVLPCS